MFWALLLIWPTDALWAQEENMVDPEFTTLMAEVRSYRNQDKKVEALESLEKAAKHAETTENTQEVIRCYFMYAELYLDLDRPTDANFYLDRINELLETTEYFYGNAASYYIEARKSYKNAEYYGALSALTEAKAESNDRNLLNRI